MSEVPPTGVGGFGGWGCGGGGLASDPSTRSHSSSSIPFDDDDDDEQAAVQYQRLASEVLRLGMLWRRASMLLSWLPADMMVAQRDRSWVREVVEPWASAKRH